MQMFGIVPVEFWRDANLRKLSSQTRLIATYLLTSEHTNIIGCFRLPLQYATADLGFSRRSVVTAIAELTSIAFLEFDPSTDYFFIKEFLSNRARKWLANPKNFTSACKAVNEIPDVVPFKEAVRLQVIEIKGTPLDDDQSTRDRRSTVDRKEEEEKEEEDRKRKGRETGAGAEAGASGAAAADASSSLSFSSYPTNLKIPLADGSEFEIDSQLMDLWQSHFPNIIIPLKLQRFMQWCEKNPQKRMSRKNIQTKLFEMLQRDDQEAKTRSR